MHCSNVRARAANVDRGIAARTPRQGSSYGVKADFPTGGPVPRSRLFAGHCTCSMSGTHYCRGYFFDCWRPMASSAARTEPCHARRAQAAHPRGTALCKNGKGSRASRYRLAQLLAKLALVILKYAERTGERPRLLRVDG
jgi:hypothetical protein